MTKIKTFIIGHKKTSAIITIIIMLLGYYGYKTFFKSAVVPTYVLSKVEKGTIVSSVTGSGQVSASNQVDVTSKVSGNIIYLGVKTGQEVKAGTLLAQIDSRNAEIDLENANISLQKLTQTNSTSLLQTQNSLSQSYDTAFNDIVSTNLDFPSVISGMNDLFYTQSGYLSDTKIQSLDQVAKDMRNSAGIGFDSAKAKQESNKSIYQSTTRQSSTDNIESLVSDTYDTVKSLNESLKDTRSAVEYIKNQQISNSSTGNVSSEATAAENNLDSWINEMNGHLSTLLAIKDSITETKNSLAQLNMGPNSLDVRSQQLSVEQKQAAYEDYFIRAPFGGVVGKLDVSSVDTVNGGTTIATLVSKQKVADISLNEVDAAKIKVGQKATLTFDAVDGLTISGEVASVDGVGVVTQGVVNYNIKITFDTDDDRVKSGMSVSAAIVTDLKQDTLLVPSSAVKSQGTNYYVEKFDQVMTTDTTGNGIQSTIPPKQQSVQVGISDDTSTEILSGLNEGDQVVTKTTGTTATVAKTTSAPSLFGGGGAGRALGR